MLHSRIDFNEDIATNVRLFNPFGPNMFYMSLKDRHTAELLEIINKLSSQQDIKDKLNAIGQIVHGTKGKENQKNSIVDGEMYPIRTEFLEENDKKIIIDVITNLTLTYGQIVTSHAKDDLALRDDSDAIEKLKKEENEYVAEIQGLWYVKMKAGDFHILHEHSTSGATFSGAIYLDVPELPWPQGNITCIPPGGENTMYNGTWQLSPKSGDIIMWPAWLLHTVYPFKSDKERIMISFNSILLTQKGEKYNAL